MTWRRRSSPPSLTCVRRVVVDPFSVCDAAGRVYAAEVHAVSGGPRRRRRHLGACCFCSRAVAWFLLWSERAAVREFHRNGCVPMNRISTKSRVDLLPVVFFSLRFGGGLLDCAVPVHVVGAVIDAHGRAGGAVNWRALDADDTQHLPLGRTRCARPSLAIARRACMLVCQAAPTLRWVFPACAKSS